MNKNYVILSDEYINDLFKGSNFGDYIDNSVLLKKEFIRDQLTLQKEGMWAGHTIYHILVRGGFLIDAKSGKKKLTALGAAFLAEGSIKPQKG